LEERIEKRQQEKDRFADVNPVQMIAYRNIREHEERHGLKIFTSEFSVPHALSVVQPLKQMIKSDNPHSRKVSTRLFKTMAILMAMSGSNGNYQQMIRPRATAYLPNDRG
jgi:hypothetical protein